MENGNRSSPGKLCTQISRSGHALQEEDMGGDKAMILMITVPLSTL